VLGWPHLLLLILLVVAVVVGLLELHYYLNKPNPMKDF